LRPKISVSNLVLRYAGAAMDANGDALALQNVEFQVGEGEVVALIGPSGCGKSTLLKLVSGLIKPTAGGIEVDGARVERVPRGIGFMFQSDALLPWKTAQQNVAIGGMLAGLPAVRAHDLARSLLEDLGLGQALHKYPSELSGGMRKRVALGRTLAYQPTLFLLDEPFAALDAQTRITVGNRFLRVFEDLRRSMILVTHDIDEAIAMADRVLVMTAASGRIAATFEVGLPRPRDYYGSRFLPRFHELQQEIWDVLRRQLERAA